MGRIEALSIGGIPFTEEGMPTSPTRPPRSSVLWRYMSLEQFIHILHYEGVFFVYPGNLDDPFEGSLPAPTIRRLRILKAAELIEHSTKKGHIVSCWHEMDHESEAMWRLYAGSGAGIAIKTDFESLMESLTRGWIDDPHDTFVAGRVMYVDYETEDIPLLHGMPLFYKRKAFSHENEVRIACFENENESIKGATHHVTIDRLIQEIVVSPFAQDWMVGVVEETTKRFNDTIAGRIRKSDLAKSTTLEMLAGIQKSVSVRV